MLACSTFFSQQYANHSVHGIQLAPGSYQARFLAATSMLGPQAVPVVAALLICSLLLRRLCLRALALPCKGTPRWSGWLRGCDPCVLLQVFSNATCCYHLVHACSGALRKFLVSFAGSNLTYQVLPVRWAETHVTLRVHCIACPERRSGHAHGERMPESNCGGPCDHGLCHIAAALHPGAPQTCLCGCSIPARLWSNKHTWLPACCRGPSPGLSKLWQARACSQWPWTRASPQLCCWTFTPCCLVLSMTLPRGTWPPTGERAAPLRQKLSVWPSD